ncbi:hypothetical protein D9M69_364290 [compost metagenome]
MALRALPQDPHHREQRQQANVKIVRSQLAEPGPAIVGTGESRQQIGQEGPRRRPTRVRHKVIIGNLRAIRDGQRHLHRIQEGKSQHQRDDNGNPKRQQPAGGAQLGQMGNRVAHQKQAG